jgi:hypothetical protein
MLYSTKSVHFLKHLEQPGYTEDELAEMERVCCPTLDSTDVSVERLAEQAKEVARVSRKNTVKIGEVIKVQPTYRYPENLDIAISDLVESHGLKAIDMSSHFTPNTTPSSSRG